MKFFIDTANLEQIQEAYDLGVLDGVTTNPSLMAKEGIKGTENQREHYIKICKIVNADVSAEVIATDYEGMIREGEELAALNPHIVVKVPCIADGIKAIKYFTEKGIRTNCTLVFSVGQALLAAKAGATYVSPFVGRLDDICENGVGLIGDIVRMYRTYDYKTQVLAASIRNTKHIIECVEMGADVATCPLSAIKGLLNHPLTDSGLKKFLEDYNALVKAVNTEITTKPDKSYGPLSDEQKDEMNETSIENWEKKAKSGLLYNNSIMRDLSLDIQSVLTKAMGSGISYDDLEEIGITMSDDPYDGGTLKFDENKFKAAMNDDPEKVGKVFTGDGGSGKGLGNIVNDTFKQYATRYSYLNGGSYGRLVEEAGSEKLALSVQNNTIYKQLKDMQDSLSSLQSKLKTEQDRYIQMFTTMEKAISSMNSQSSYLSSLTG